MPSPPRNQPTSARARSTSACDMPQRSISMPANTNEGIASSTQFCDPATRLEGSICRGKPPSASPTMPAMPSANTIGIESATKATNTIAVAVSSIHRASTAAALRSIRPSAIPAA